MKSKEIRELTDEQLASKLDEARAELFNLSLTTLPVCPMSSVTLLVFRPRCAPARSRPPMLQTRREGRRRNMSDSRNSRKVRTGVVSSISGDKTITVQITERKPHSKYGKMITVSKKLHAHDENNEAGLGDTVTVMETRPLSKTKRWRLVEIVEKAK